MSLDLGATAATTEPAYRWSHIAPGDVAAWTELTNLLATVDRTEEFYEAEDLAEELTETGVDPEQDTWAVWAGDTMVGYGQVRVDLHLDREDRVRCWVGGGVHPDHRGRGLGRRLMDLMERRVGALADQRHPGHASYVRASGELEGASVRPLLEHRGYRIVRYFNLMVRELPGDPVDVAGADGVVLRLPVVEDEVAVLTAHNAAFVDHWGSVPTDASVWHDRWTGRSSRLEPSTLAVGEDGKVVSYVLCSEWVPRELYVGLVGTVPDARGRGLARACLARTISAAAQSGRYDRIDLDVDSASLTGATRLYEAVGFRVKHTTAAYQLG
jgi:mycothiol synthase